MKITQDLINDIFFAVSCMQDYRDTIDTGTNEGEDKWDSVSNRIIRLIFFANELED